MKQSRGKILRSAVVMTVAIFFLAGCNDGFKAKTINLPKFPESKGSDSSKKQPAENQSSKQLLLNSDTLTQLKKGQGKLVHPILPYSAYEKVIKRHVKDFFNQSDVLSQLSKSEDLPQPSSEDLELSLSYSRGESEILGEKEARERLEALKAKFPELNELTNGATLKGSSGLTANNSQYTGVINVRVNYQQSPYRALFENLQFIIYESHALYLAEYQEKTYPTLLQLLHIEFQTDNIRSQAVTVDKDSSTMRPLDMKSAWHKNTPATLNHMGLFIDVDQAVEASSESDQTLLESDTDASDIIFRLQRKYQKIWCEIPKNLRDDRADCQYIAPVPAS